MYPAYAELLWHETLQRHTRVRCIENRQFYSLDEIRTLLVNRELLWHYKLVKHDTFEVNLYRLDQNDSFFCKGVPTKWRALFSTSSSNSSYFFGPTSENRLAEEKIAQNLKSRPMSEIFSLCNLF